MRPLYTAAIIHTRSMFSYIKKIDDPAHFAMIHSGITKESELGDDEQAKLNTWANALKAEFQPGENQLTWFRRNMTPILMHIQSTYKNPSTRRSHMNAMANIVLGIDKQSGVNVGLARLLFAEVNQLGTEIAAAKGDNHTTPEFLANYVPYAALVAARDVLAASDQRSHVSRMRYLILCLGTYIPPLRLDWLNMRVYRNKKPPPADDTNYLWGYAPQKYAIVMNADKIEGRRQAAGRERQVIRLDDDLKGITDGSTLNGILDKNLAAEPRDYVLTGNDGSPMASSTYNLILAQMFVPRSPTQNMIRKAYINHWYADEQKLTEGQLKQIADRMRHTKETARSSYRKVDAPTELVALSNPPIDRKAKQRDATQKFRANHPELVARTKLISSINSSKRTPKKDTMERHQLYRDPLGKWRSHLDD